MTELINADLNKPYVWTQKKNLKEKRYTEVGSTIKHMSLT